jgi:O6-methylguanine-DNA--protein-cysteine methyltransferase
MANSQDQFEARVRDTHKRLRRYEESLKELEAYFHERPQGSADALLLSVPVQLEVWRKYASSRFGVDLEDREQRKKLRWSNLADAWEYTLLAYRYDVTDNAWSLMMLAHTTGERGERLARLICAAYLLAWKRMPGMIAATIEAFQKAVPHLANEAGLAEYLTGYLATHISMETNLRLRAGIDERREEGERRFPRLLRELPAEALAANAERPPAWGDLMDLRTEVARRLEKREAQSDKKELIELAAFADRETLLKLAKGARLSAQELEVFELCTANPGVSYREIAERLGMKSTSQVGVVKHRIKRKLLATRL